MATSNGCDNYFSCSRVAVIGAGAAGIVMAKYLIAEKCFDSIVVYEQRARPGGLWQHTPGHDGDAFFRVPQTSPDAGLEIPLTDTADGGDLVFVTPVYDALETNIPRHLMQLSDHHFPDHLPLYPAHPSVLQYLDDYSSDIGDYIQYHNQVVDIVPRRAVKDQAHSKTIWNVKGIHLVSGQQTDHDFDAVIIANGHYCVPHIPAVTGLEQWAKQHPGSVTHSKYFRNTQHLVNKRVLVVGNSASGLDIAAQLSAVCRLPVYLSQRSAYDMAFASQDCNIVRSTAEIDLVKADTRQVELKDGQTINDIDSILFCTGYFYSLPFLQRALPDLITDGSMVHGTFKHVFYAPDPTLSFVALPQKVIPFPVAEMQAAVIARVYAGRLSLPPEDKMRQWERLRLIDQGGRLDRFHTLGYPADAEYMDMLVDWASQAHTASGLENQGRGKMARKWTVRERWIRQYVPLIKQAYVARGNGRSTVRSVEELGFTCSV